MKVITAPEIYYPTHDEISVFLAGGITNCTDWQSEVIRIMPDIGSTNNLVIFNPRRDNFPINDPNAARDQIKWEFDALNKMDIFSMYFCGGESDQPICMYELGRYISQIQMRFPCNWWERIVVSCEDNYKRKQDVKIQVSLGTDNQCRVRTNQDAFFTHGSLPMYHAAMIWKAYALLNYCLV